MSGVPPNKGMKLTRPERIGASQLIPGVGPTWKHANDDDGGEA
jgi:hypothetical protein